MNTIEAGVLAVGYLDDGPPGGWPVALSHGFPYDVHAYDSVVPLLTGYDWGGLASCVVSALWPERVAGLVCLASYDIIDIEGQQRAFPPAVEHAVWSYEALEQRLAGRPPITRSRA